MKNQIFIHDLKPELVALMEGPVPPSRFPSDGCTCAPDWWMGHDLRPACIFHDWRYSCGGSEQDRKDADQAFCRNLMRCGAVHEVAGVYYRRVRLEGIALYAYHTPLTRWQKLQLCVTCFFSRYLPIPLQGDDR